MTTPYVPQFRYFPVEERLQQRELVNSYSDLAVAINQREIGLYNTAENSAGQQYFATTVNGNLRDVWRTVYSIGAVAAGATSTTAHNIDSLSSVTRIYGVAVTTTPDYRPMPYASVAAANQGIELRITSANIIIVNGAAAPNISSAVVVVEYIK